MNRMWSFLINRTTSPTELTAEESGSPGGHSLGRVLPQTPPSPVRSALCSTRRDIRTRVSSDMFANCLAVAPLVRDLPSPQDKAGLLCPGGMEGPGSAHTLAPPVLHQPGASCRAQVETCRPIYLFRRCFPPPNVARPGGTIGQGRTARANKWLLFPATSGWGLRHGRSPSM